MSSYQNLITTRPTPPDPPTLQAQLRAAVAPETGVIKVSETIYRLKTDLPLTPGQLTTAQTILDTAPAQTPQSIAQAEIDHWPITQKALVVAITKQFNVIRSKLSPPLPDLTKEQVLAAIRNEAGLL